MSELAASLQALSCGLILGWALGDLHGAAVVVNIAAGVATAGFAVFIIDRRKRQH